MKFRASMIMVAVLVALGATYIAVTRQSAPPEAQKLPPMWSVEPNSIQTVSIALPRENLAEAWTLGDGGSWYFRSTGERVSEERWGLAVPLLLSGPHPVRLIQASATPDQLQTYGLATPRVRIELGIVDSDHISVEIGDSTPDGSADYLRVAGETKIYSIHRTFAEVVERLVREPPREGNTAG